MVAWSIVFSSTAERNFTQVDFTLRNRIVEKLDWLREHFDAVTPQFLAGELSDFFKLRVGDWRVFYRVQWDTHVIVVHNIVHRSKAYKG